jgi:uncharacterized protein YcbX
MQVGIVKELWRYPVKSLGGERLAAARVSKHGLVGDRVWAFVDAASGEIRSAKQIPRLLELRAGFAAGAAPTPESFGDAVAAVEVVAPDGARYRARDPGAQASLAAALGAPVRLVPLAPPEDRAHYRLRAPRNGAEIAAQIDLQPGEPMPDFSGTPPELLRTLLEYATPPGSYTDAYPVHLLTTAAVAALHERSGLDTDRLRFRPNLFVDTGETRGFPEFEWIGKRVRVGEAILAVESKTIRCSMPARAQPQHGLAAEPRLTAALVVHSKRHIGVYAHVEREGEIHAGDPVLLVE